MRKPRSLVLIVIVCVIAVLAIGCLVLRPVLMANSIRHEISEFRYGPFSIERLRKWATDHSGTITCHGSKCEADVVVYNWPLYASRLTVPTLFSAEIDTKNGKIKQTSLHLSNISYSSKTTGAATMLVVHFAHEDDIESSLGAHGVHLGQNPIGKPPMVVYSVDLNAAPYDLNLAYDINVWCLARIGGCSGPEQAPEVWTLRTRK